MFGNSFIDISHGCDCDEINIECECFCHTNELSVNPFQTNVPAYQSYLSVSNKEVLYSQNLSNSIFRPPR